MAAEALSKALSGSLTAAEALSKALGGTDFAAADLTYFGNAEFDATLKAGGTATMNGSTIEIYARTVGFMSATFTDKPQHFQFRIRHRDGKVGTVAFSAGGAVQTHYDEAGVTVNGMLLPWK